VRENFPAVRFAPLGTPPAPAVAISNDRTSSGRGSVTRLLVAPVCPPEGAEAPVTTRDIPSSMYSPPPAAVYRWNVPLSSTPTSPCLVVNFTGANVNGPPVDDRRTF